MRRNLAKRPANRRPKSASLNLELYGTVDCPEIGHAPDPDNPVALRTCSVSGTEFGCMTARPLPHKFVTLRRVRFKGVRFEDCRL
jgi:hypothetical protein